MIGACAGTWEIPVVGEVVITAAGLIIVGGAVITAGNWIYKAITDYLISKTAKAYETAKKNGTKAKNNSTKHGGSLGRTDEPYSSKDLNSSGKLKQRRFYDENGDADMDIDYSHGGNGKEPFPHRHDWTNGHRGNAYQ